MANFVHKDKQYQLNEAEILHLIAAGYLLAHRHLDPRRLAKPNPSQVIQHNKLDFIALAQEIVPVPFP